MSVSSFAFVPVLWIALFSRSLAADETGPRYGYSRWFDDDESLPALSAEQTLVISDYFALVGFGGAAARLELETQDRRFFSAVFAVSLAEWQRSFEPRALSWGRSQHIQFGAALGYGYGLSGRFEVGPFVTTNALGSGFFLHLGGEGEIRSTLGRAFAQTPIGYYFQRRSVQLEVALVPSLGRFFLIRESGEGTPSTIWLRERLHLRVSHVELNLEHGRGEQPKAATWRAALCAVGSRATPSACVSVESLEDEFAPHASLYELGVFFGAGVYRTDSSAANAYSTPRQ